MSNIVRPSDDETFLILICHIESIVSGHPIAPVSHNPLDKEPLTRNHLLLLRKELSFPLGNVTQRDVHEERWRKVQHLANEFWLRWTKEHLQSLQQRT